MRSALLIAVAAVVTFLAACGGGSPGAHLSQQSGALAFSQCMRSNGVQSFPDPGTGGTIPKESLEQLGVSSSRFQTARGACRHLLPNGGQPPSQAVEQQVRAQSLRFSECVRAHGVPGFPDPGSDGRIPDPATVGIDQGSPTFEAANRACGKYRPPYMPSNSAYNAWARAHPNGS